MADRILVMNDGKVVQSGEPAGIYEKPATPFVASFIGSMNFMDRARKVEPGIYDFYGQTFQVDHENGAGKLIQGDRATLAIRPEDVTIDPSDETGINRFSGLVETMEYRGSLFRLGLSLAASSSDMPLITADVPTEKIRRFSLACRQTVSISLPADRLLVYESGDGHNG